MLWSGEERYENPELTFPIKIRIITELLIDERAALYIQKGS